MMRRRDFITLLGGATVARPLAASAQQPMPVIGYLYSGAAETSAHLLAAFRKGLDEGGYVEGRNVAIEYRFAGNQDDRLPELAADLVNRRVTLIVTPGTPVAALAAKAATTTIPIVFRTGADPMQSGLVTSINRPGGNVTGINTMSGELGAKQIGLLYEFFPPAKRFGVLVNPRDPSAGSWINDVQAGSAAIGRQHVVFSASGSTEIDAAFAGIVQQDVDALLVGPQGLFNNRRRTPRISSVKSASTLPASSRAKNQRTYRFCARRNSSSSSICRRQKRSGLRCRQTCSHAPTR
jgi:putative ABC transport system substrate-binding protein